MPSFVSTKRKWKVGEKESTVRATGGEGEPKDLKLLINSFRVRIYLLHFHLTVR